MKKSICNLCSVAAATFAAIVIFPQAHATPLSVWVNFPTNPIQTGDLVALEAAIGALDSPFTGISSISWSFDGGGGTALSLAGSNPSTFRYDAPGNYDVAYIGNGTEYYDVTTSQWVTSGYMHYGGYTASRWVNDWPSGYWEYYWVPLNYWVDTSHYETFQSRYFQDFTVTGSGTILVESPSSSIPDSGTTAVMLGAAFAGFVALRRKLT